MPAKRIHIHAVVRVDLFQPDSVAPPIRISVVKAFSSFAKAESEASRLSTLKDAKDCLYFAQTTRLILDDDLREGIAALLATKK